MVSSTYPKPLKIAAPARLVDCWNKSPDSKGEGKAPGIDGQTARSFSKKLHSNIGEICDALKCGQYQFSRLRFHAIPKSGGKERILCIPTVRDRLVQRVILNYLLDNDKLGIRNEISYGFIPSDDHSVQKAINFAAKLRETNQYVIKTDIVSFFDRIEREALLAKFPYRIKKSSIFPLLGGVVRSELAQIKHPDDKAVLEESGLVKGLGLRQGMPLSPLLSSFYLREFDKKLILRKIPIVRYADDLIAFCNSQNDASLILELIAECLSELGLEIPKLSQPESKSVIHGPGENFEFLGIEYRLIDGEVKKYVPKAIFDRVSQRLAMHEDWREAHRRGRIFSDTSRILNAMESSYSSSYRDTENHASFRSHVNKGVAEVNRTIFSDIFPPEIVDQMDKIQRQYLSLERKTRRQRRRKSGKSKFVGNSASHNSDAQRQ